MTTTEQASRRAATILTAALAKAEREGDTITADYISERFPMLTRLVAYGIWNGVAWAAEEMESVMPCPSVGSTKVRIAD